ncbi:histidine ammonia-lyase [Psychroflexus salis]|uniref:Histidine ammonia-lyase n=1 Tax=Psychroflexus salis TaxID=1526574 RepID=A0A916ZZY4_9FLAO|nr:histidine ammonia-lyase [Psychroflexus salis]GGE19375.1 histidine ammonia-lyase [Psychroflexus salis]
MDNTFYISSALLSLTDIYLILKENKKIELSEEAIQNIKKSRSYLNKKQDLSEKAVYGINTGFGSLCNIKISDDQLLKLQENLVLSHACGTGDQVDFTIVKLMLLLKIQSLSYGHSGISLEVVNRLINFFNYDILPVVYEQGSLGASGDLAPLAHLALPLLGKGKVKYKNKIIEANLVLKELNWKALILKSKEGLALLNGTQFMSAHGVFALLEAHRLTFFADVIAAISIDAFDCNMSPFDQLVHQIRPHAGQVKTAKRINALLEGSELAKTEKQNVQDPYSFRCVPQVHGATKDAIDFTTKCIKTEINSVTDNPNVFVDEDKIISGGNFHGQPIALSLDFLAIAIAELGNISERRIYQLVSGSRNLPAFLIHNSGVNSGFMIPQYTAASIVSQNKQLCTPATVDSIVSSNGQEDHVSMGANAATKLIKVATNLKTILAIELFNASQALSFRDQKSSVFVENLIAAYRKHVPIVKEDCLMHNEIEKSIRFLDDYKVDLETFLND